MWHVIGSATLSVLLLAAAGSAGAGAAAPEGPGVDARTRRVVAPAGTPQDRMGELRGTVRFVDPRSNALRVAREVSSGEDAVLQIIDATRVRVGEREGSVADLRQGVRIRASYQDRYGIKVAHLIEVTAAPGRS